MIEMAARGTLRAINNGLARRTARLAKASGYFYFQFGQGPECLDRTLNVSTVSSRAL